MRKDADKDRMNCYNCTSPTPSYTLYQQAMFHLSSSNTPQLQFTNHTHQSPSPAPDINPAQECTGILVEWMAVCGTLTCITNIVFKTFLRNLLVSNEMIVDFTCTWNVVVLYCYTKKWTASSVINALKFHLHLNSKIHWTCCKCCKVYSMLVFDTVAATF